MTKPIAIIAAILAILAVLFRKLLIRLVLLLPLLFRLLVTGALLAVHVGLAVFIYRDARKRRRLFLDIPAWLWACVGLGLGVIGLAAYWAANDLCLREPSAHDERIESV